MWRKDLLKERLVALAGVQAWTPLLLSALEARLTHPDDAQAHLIDPLRFAQDLGAEPDEAVDFFLHAAKQSLVEMIWGLVCPVCGDTVKSFATLSLVHSRFACKLCARETEVSLDDWVKVSFTVMADLRDLRYRRPEGLKVDDFLLNCRFNTPGKTQDGRDFRDVFLALTRHMGWLAPGETRTVTVEAVPGVLRIYDFLEETGETYPVAATGSRTAGIAFSGRTVAPDAVPPMGAGPLTLTLANPSPFRRALIVLNYPIGFTPPAQVLGPFLTGREVLASQAFRRLFRNESVASSAPLGVRELTFLFTDLKGSTALYGRVGDMRAFELVRRHFETLGQAIAANRGALVKTIGDAVMATFLRPEQALRAALAMVDELNQMNRAEGARDLIIKVGIHSGATIAVTLNDRLDYFGQTVNIAARVQALAAADEICITAEAYAQPGVADVAAACRMVRSNETLRGIGGLREIVRVQPASPLRGVG